MKTITTKEERKRIKEKRRAMRQANENSIGILYMSDESIEKLFNELIREFILTDR